MTLDVKSCRNLIIGLSLAVLVARSPLGAQGACPCSMPEPFGSCAEKTAAYPDLSPGAAVILPPGTGRPATLLVADLFSGVSFRYEAGKFDTANPVRVFSPLGSNATTGLTFRQEGTDIVLLWAIEGKIYQTDANGNSLAELGTVDLGRLAQLLRDGLNDPNIVPGSLGGITYHETRGSLWGVDIVNDVYFEFGVNGALVLTEGKPNFFLNPRRNKLAGGAYGNSIAYARSGGREYFDIPVGSLTDGRPTEVHRVHATSGVAPDAFKIGDSTGIAYALGTSVGSPKFVTGIAFFPDSCGANQASEILLNFDQVGGAPQIIQVAADEPTAASIADFTCVESGLATVTLTWRKTLPYTQLTITRQFLGRAGSLPVTVFENADFANDPQRFEDIGVLDGPYDYTATLTAAQPVATVHCRVSLGIGSLAAHRRFVGDGSKPDAVPFAIAVVNADKVLVADLNEGTAQSFDLNLNPTGTVKSPVENGLTVGLEWHSDSKFLFWLENDTGRHFLHVTDVSGNSQGNRNPVDTPLSINGPVQLGDISFDPVKSFFWTVDLLHERIYAITSLGAIPPEFKNSQITNPEANGILGGGIAVAAGDAQKVTLDVTLGRSDPGILEQIGRFEYSRTNLATKTEVRRIDLSTTTGATDFGGIAIATQGPDVFEYVVGVDTRTIYKLKLTSATSQLGVFRRGDVNNDGGINISDPSALLSNLFKGGPAPPCALAADVDNSDVLDITDAVNLFTYLFKGGPPPAPPFAECGIEIGSVLTCAQATCADA